MIKQTSPLRPPLAPLVPPLAPAPLAPFAEVAWCGEPGVVFRTRMSGEVLMQRRYIQSVEPLTSLMLFWR